MNKTAEQTAGRKDGALSWFSGIMGLTRVLGVILFLALLHNPVQSFSATLPVPYVVAFAWDSSPSPEVTGYRVYYGAASGNYTNSVAVGKVKSVTVPGLASGVTYFFAVNANNASGLESAFSNELTFTVPGGPPAVHIRMGSNRQAVLTVTGQIGHTYDIQATQTLTNWAVIGSVTLGTSGLVDFTDTNAASYPKRFYRTRDTQP